MLGLDEEQCEAEIRILAATGVTMDKAALIQKQQAAAERGDNAYAHEVGQILRFLGEDEPPRDRAWATGVVALLEQYHFLMQVRGWLPAILRLPASFQTILSKKGDLDEYVSGLNQQLASLEREWPQCTLRTVDQSARALRGLFRGLTKHQLEFVSLLANEGESLCLWLIEKNDTDQFNKLMQVARGGLDDARLLSAMASLVGIRTLLLKQIYGEEQVPYTGLESFLEYFEAVEVSEVAIADLKNILASFDALIEVFEKQTRSAGVKACYDLVAIKERGSFVFQTSENSERVLLLELASNSEHDARTEPIEYLVDLRNNLMMTEVPTEVEDELGVEALIGSFVLQLRTLTEIKEALCTLHAEGHFGYQTYNRKFRFDMSALPELRRVLTEYRKEVESFRAVVKAQREENYFLNFFTMREIILLWGMLKEQKVADFSSLLWLVSSNLDEGQIILTLPKL